ncbi:hypothetical protein GCM10023197_46530 [Gordonia humi]|uniref:GAF domain-containing protein n=2 Tax=Gordonia humi TaxID=686429 RepID=A0A840F2G4_9ACTN|nr:GAF domain-containing protein [Gordonia humi]
MTRDERWPTFLTAVRHHTPVRSSLAIELYATDQELGALNLYAETTGAFTRDSVALALNLASHAAIALSSARREEQFDSAAYGALGAFHVSRHRRRAI